MWSPKQLEVRPEGKARLLEMFARGSKAKRFSGPRQSRIGISIFILSVFLCSPVYPQDAVSPVKIIGVTNGSVYTGFVKPRWYEKAPVTSTLQKNSGAPEPFTNGGKISENGNYRLVVTKSVEGKALNTVRYFTIDASAGRASIFTNIDVNGMELIIRFTGGTYVKDPVFAIWTEDMAGNYLQDLYVSAVPATNIMRFTDNYVLRPQALPYWAHKACPERRFDGELLYLADPAIPLPKDLDAVTGATQKWGYDVVTKTRPVLEESKIIKVYFEINQSWDWGWYFRYDNANHEEDGKGKLGDDKFFSKKTGCGEPSLIYMIEVDLSKPQTYLLGGSDGIHTKPPIGYGHYAGRTGRLYTDFYADDHGKQRYKFDHADKMVKSLTVEVIPSYNE